MGAFFADILDSGVDTLFVLKFVWQSVPPLLPEAALLL